MPGTRYFAGIIRLEKYTQFTTTSRTARTASTVHDFTRYAVNMPYSPRASISIIRISLTKKPGLVTSLACEALGPVFFFSVAFAGSDIVSSTRARSRVFATFPAGRRVKKWAPRVPVGRRAAAVFNATPPPPAAWVRAGVGRCHA